MLNSSTAEARIDKTEAAFDVASQPQAPISPYRIWGVVALLSMVFAMGMVDRVILSMVVDPLKTDLSLSDTQIGIAQGAAVALFYVIFALPIGWASDRFDRRRLLFIGISVWSLASASCAFVQNFEELFIARCLIGAGEAVIGPCGYPLIASIVSRKRLAFALMLFYIGGTSGVALGQFLGGYLQDWLAETGTIGIAIFDNLPPWRAMFLVTGLPGILLAFLVFIAPRDKGARSSAAAPEVDGGGFRSFFSTHKRFYISHNLGIGFQQASLMGLLLWNSTFMARSYGWTPAEVGTMFGLISFVTAVSAVIGHSWLSTKLFFKGHQDIHLRWQLYMSILAIPAIAFGYLSSSPVAAAIGFGLANLLLGGTVVAGPTILQIATPHAYRGRVSGMYVVVASLLGIAAGPSLVGFFTDKLLGDEMKVGVAIASSCIMFCLAAIAAFAVALPATRRIVSATAQAPLA